MPSIDKYLEEIVAKGASDLHISSGRSPMLRLFGIIKKMETIVLDDEIILSWIKEITPPFYLQQFQNSNDADFAYSIKNQHRFRVNIFKDRCGFGAVFRYIPNNLPTFDQILLEDGAKNLTNLNKGLVLVTGPTGSGKSTTLASMINHINQTKSYHIITIEDPIEFVYQPKRSLIHQRELNLHTKSYYDALRTALRQDPDVILIGEMRDIETTRLAIESAETGHLVFSTLHTNSAYSTISRIINQFGEEEQELIRVMLADNLKGVICQTLLRRENTAQEGRVAAREIWLYTVGGANLIRENKIHQIPSLIDGNQEMGMISLNASLSNLVSQGIISPNTAWQNSIDQKDLAGRLQRLGYKIEGVPNV